MGRGFLIFLIVFSLIFALQIVGYCSPYWETRCVRKYDDLYNIDHISSYNETCFNQGLCYECDDNGNCKLTKIIDSTIFGLAVAIVSVNIVVLVLSILVIAHAYEDYRKKLKKRAVQFFLFSELLNGIATIYVFGESYTFGWSWWVTSWSAFAVLAILVLFFLVAIICYYDDDDDEESSNTTNTKRYNVFYYVVEDD